MVFLGLGVVSFIGQYRLVIDTDLVSSLPQDDPIVSDARYVISRHPLQDRVVIDLGQRSSNPELLITGGAFVEKRLEESGLFKSVGLTRHQQLFPDLLAYVIGHFPVLFSEQDLKGKIAPLLAPEEVRRTLMEAHKVLTGLEGIGQSGLIAQDPLGLRNIVLKRLSALGASKNVFLDQGRLLSEDKKHLLILAEPVTSGYNTDFSRKVTALIEAVSLQLNQQNIGRDLFTLTHVGAYRAALDNETAARTGTRRAVLISTIAIALLLILGFPRPWIGLLALVPAFGGSIMGLFVYSLFQKSVSILSIGFGGAIISFTVDYGIAYLLFLDRSHETYGLEVTKEVWPLGLLAMLTTAVSFAFLFIAGFPALTQLGLFASLGVLFTFIFVHAIYPFLFPVVSPAKRDRILPLQRLSDQLAGGGLKTVCLAVLFGLVMLFSAKLDFRVDLTSLNTVSPLTQAAEKLIREVWGDVTNRVYLAIEGKTIRELQRKEDRLADLLEDEIAKETVAAAFVPSMLFPGEDLAKRNFTAWKAFWTPERVDRLREDVKSNSPRLGFSPGAFSSFFVSLEEKFFQVPMIPSAFFPFLGIENRPGSSWTQYATIQPGRLYQGGSFYKRVTSLGLAKVFDPILFSQRLGEMILNGFIRVTVIVGVMTFLVAFFYLFHWRLTFVTLLPTLFSLICTFGTLRLLRQPLGIPVIMVAAVVIGMGTDYALYLVRAHQRYLDEHHPSVSLIRLSVLMSFSTTFIGFGVLALSGHALLKTAGLALALGIGYSYLGTIAFVPPLLKKILVPAEFGQTPVVPGSKLHYRQTLSRYRHLEPYPRLFARFKLLLDPLFPRLAEFVGKPDVILDIGTGYGVPAVWLLEILPQTRLYGFDPKKKRVLFASQAIGNRGIVTVGSAPHLPEIPEKVDTVLLLDMLHYLNNRELEQTLQRLKEAINPKGRLVIRVTILSKTSASWMTFWELKKLKFFKIPAYFRKIVDLEKALNHAGFRVIRVEPSKPDREEHWILADRDSD